MPRIAPVISLTVVLPLLPVIPTTVPREVATPCAGEAASSASSVSGTTTCGDRRRDQAAHERARRAAGRRLRHEVMPVEALAAQRNEQRAGLERAAVGGHGAEAGAGSVQHAAGDAGEFGEVADHASSPSASSTTARSLNGRTSWPTSW